MTDPSNWRSSKLLFRKVGFPICSQKCFSTSVTSLPVSICISKSNLLILTISVMFFFLLFIFFYILAFVFYWKDFHIGFVFFNSFNVFLFEFAYSLKFFFLFCLAICTSFSNAGNFSLFISCSRPQYELKKKKSFLTCKHRRIFVRWVDFIIFVFLY